MFSIPLVIAADDDFASEGNPGLSRATEAAEAIGARVAIPDFGDNRPGGATDFNDLHRVRGLTSVKACLQEVLVDREKPELEGVHHPVEWPAPQPFTARVYAQPYPLEALPGTIRAAVEEVQAFVQAPVSLVASSALAALSLAAQTHWDIKRAEKLSGPTGLFLLTIADSGERKSTCDGFFTKVIREYEAQQNELAKPLLKNYQADLKAWEAKQSGVKQAIQARAKSGKDTQDLEFDIRNLEGAKPEPPKVPRLVYADATPESLKWSLAKTWPSGGVVSSEAGIVFGAHGMRNESAMMNLATLNTLWDGAEIATERRASESFTVRGARLTIALQVQEATLRAFFDQSGTLARGSGFMARFLLAWPDSTQGSRAFKEAPASWPNLGAFTRRVEHLLNQPAPFDQDGVLSPSELTFSTEAKAAWVAFHDRIERELPAGERLHDIRDVASKIADNAARLAALFHAFEGAPGGVVSPDSFNSAARVAEWHLNEARRFFGELALPTGLADAVRLEAWLITRCKKGGVCEVPTKEIQQFGPNGLREKAKIEAALLELEDLGRAQRHQEGRRKFIALHPFLLSAPVPATAIPAIPATPATDGSGPPYRRQPSSPISRNSDSSPDIPGILVPSMAVSGRTRVVDL